MSGDILYQQDAPHLSGYFQMLKALPDTAEKPDDGPDTRITKARTYLARLYSVYQLTTHPGYRVIDQHFGDMVRVITGEKIWEALAVHDQSMIDELRAKQKGIVMLFEFFDELPTKIEEFKKYINGLSGKPEDNPLDIESLHI
jgi:hypothetical protein